MDNSRSPFLSPSAPQLLPPQKHTRSTSRSPTRLLSPNDDFLSDLSPARAFDLFTNPAGRLKPALEAASRTDRAFGTRAALASKNIQEWVDELEGWKWPAEGGSLGFEEPAGKRRKLSNGSEYTQKDATKARESQYIGSLLALTVKEYETRVEQIHNEMEELNVEEIKRQVLDTHFSPRSRPSSSVSNAPITLTSSYNRMDDFTAIVTAIVLKALPNLSRLMRLMDIWGIRLTVLRGVPRLLRRMEEAEAGLKSGWKAINIVEHSASDNAHQEALSRKAFAVMHSVLQSKVTELGQHLDSMLDTLEGRQDTLPDAWLDRMESIEHDYGEWTVAGDRKVREGEWATVAQMRRERDEEKRKQEEEAARVKAEFEAEVLRKRQLEEAAELRAAEFKAAELKAAELRAAELKAAELKAAELRAAELKAAELKAAELRAAELKASELRAAELKAAQMAEAAAVRARAEKEEKEEARLRAAEEAKANEEDIKAGRETHEAEIGRTRMKEEEEAQEDEQAEIAKSNGEPVIADRKIIEQPHVGERDEKSTTQSQPLDVRNSCLDDQKETVDVSIGDQEAQDLVAMHPGAEKQDTEGNVLDEQDGLKVWHQQHSSLEEENSPQIAPTRLDENPSAQSPEESSSDALKMQVDEKSPSATHEAEHSTRAEDNVMPEVRHGTPKLVDKRQTEEKEQHEDGDQNKSIEDVGRDISETFQEITEPKVLPVEETRLQHAPSGTNDNLLHGISTGPSPKIISQNNFEIPTEAETDETENDVEQSQDFQAQKPPPHSVTSLRDTSSPFSLAIDSRLAEKSVHSQLTPLRDSEAESSNNFSQLHVPHEHTEKAEGEETVAGLSSVEDQPTTIIEKQRFSISQLQGFEPLSEISKQHVPGSDSNKAEQIRSLDGPADLDALNSEPETVDEATTESEVPVASHSIPNGDVSEAQHELVSQDLPSGEKDADFFPPPVNLSFKSTSSPSSPTTPTKNLRELGSIKYVMASDKIEIPTNSDDRPMQDRDDDSTSKSAKQDQTPLASSLHSYSDMKRSSEIPEGEPAQFVRQFPESTQPFHEHDSQVKPRTPPTSFARSIDESSPPRFTDSGASLRSLGKQVDGAGPDLPAPEDFDSTLDMGISDGTTEYTPKKLKPGVLHMPVLARRTSVTRINSGVRQVLIPRKDSVSSNDSATANGSPTRALKSPMRPSTPPLQSGTIDSPRGNDDLSPSIRRHRHIYSSSDSPPSIPDLSNVRNRVRDMSISSTNAGETFSADLPLFENVNVSATPPASPKKNNSEDQIQQQISSLLESIPARIHLTSEPIGNLPDKLVVKKTRPSGASTLRSSSSLSTYSRAPTPSFTLAPAHTKGPSRQRPQNGNPEIKLYHLSRSTGEAPIKLFVRLVGEHGERVMVRVGGGWADLGEYLREYASHHGRRSAAVDNNKVEIQDLPPRVVSISSSTSTATLRGYEWPSPAARPGSAFDRPMSSLNIRKSRKSAGAGDLEPPPHNSNLRSPSTPLPSSSIRAYQYDTPPSAASSSASTSTSASGNPVYDRSSSRLSWTEEDSSLGLAGPKSKRVVISERDQEWVDSMKEKVRTASVEKEKPKHPGTRKSFGEMEKVGGTKRLFRKS